MRAAVGRAESPAEVILNSQSVPTPAIVQQAVGFDQFKMTKGRKRHTVVDTLGLVMYVLVTARVYRNEKAENGCYKDCLVCLGCESLSPLPSLGGWWL